MTHLHFLALMIVFIDGFKKSVGATRLVDAKTRNAEYLTQGLLAAI